ncbi:MAG: tRNA (adenosine(37)-N6)-threonylcarbamoyltransferase complex dimerization subunit type 1 TsaB [Synechococcales cyanobacterium C42_A2020_086]|nr:tRNA (adenosine(37)-N6)-threonylcarbamoyltransferase complex dimerization subunit type 1 TsaB [Synechococcales cyanobacterium C42_A2020_086]
MSSVQDPNRYALALHTTSADLGLALSNFADAPRCQTWDLGRDVSNYLHLYLAKFLQPQSWTDLDFLAVANGPGGFTSTRLGVVTARTLAQQLDLPLFAISTLAAVAWAEYRAGRIPSAAYEAHALDSANSCDIAVYMPAHRGELHGAIYRIAALHPHADTDPTVTLVTCLGDAVWTPDQWQQTLTDWPRPCQQVQAMSHLGHTAFALLELAYHQWQRGQRPHWSEVLPIYGQSPV